MGTYRKSVREILRRRASNKQLKKLYKISRMTVAEKTLYFMDAGNATQVHYKKRSLWQKIKRAFRKLFTFRKW